MGCGIIEMAIKAIPNLIIPCKKNSKFHGQDTEKFLEHRGEAEALSCTTEIMTDVAKG